MRSRLLSLLLFLPAPLFAQQAQALPDSVAVGVRLASELAHVAGDKVWPGWSAAPEQQLLIADSTESFIPKFGDPVQWTRRRIFPPQMQATFPAVGGVPTIVIGTPAASHQPVERWALTFLHEHLHQFQYSRPDYYPRLDSLGLKRGDTTGMWALNFPFPYDSAPVATALTHWARTMAMVLRGDHPPSRTDLRELRAARVALDALLAPDDRKYLDFQLWQEGVPRWTELAMARAGRNAGLISAAELAWQEDRLVRDLETLDPAGDKRVIVYPLGAAVVELLTREGKPWQARYLTAMFALPSP